ncbi:hypothetical protein B0J15DRAFT_518413 [Fusarium solani]|uniref:NmrA-like domain-containing protein n=1 Tax=Fusarium solani TaxID=169388 RepID=A0A9P9FZ97_FUSSL|nr:uncharacterized protein B0J15DRAFT_518413 [Fusarium solani]KAH7227254.1 hypothetical protein B0J15DRAFT_518413 [Fusarium solani]
MTIALAGGTSSIGRSIVDGLLEQGRNDFIIFSRTTHPTLQTHTVDYTDVDKLVHELEQLRIEVVISALSIDNQSSGRAQLNLIDAARRSRCVRRFIPSEYGGIDYSPDPEIRHIPPYLYKVEAAKALEASGLEYARISNGFLLDYWSAPRLPTYLRELFVMWVDFANNFAALPGDGSATIVVTHSRDIGRAVARLLSLVRWEPRYCVIGNRLTMNQIVQTAEDIKGEKFQVHYDPADRLREGHITLTPRLRAYADRQGERTREQLTKSWATTSLRLLEGHLDYEFERSLNKIFPDMGFITIRDAIKAWKD